MAKKRWIWFLVVSIMLSLAVLASGIVSADGPAPITIQVSEAGDDSNDGLSVGTPVKTLERAFQLLTEANQSYEIMIGDGEFPSPGEVIIPENAQVLVTSSGKSTIYKNPEKPSEKELIKVENSKFKMLEFNNLKFTGDNPETADLIEQEGTGVYIYNCDYKPGNEVFFDEVEFGNLGLGIYQELSDYITLRILRSKIKSPSPISMDYGKEFILENSVIEIVNPSGIWSSLVYISKPLTKVEINENTFVGEQGRGRAIDGNIHNASIEANTFKDLLIAIEADTGNTLIERNHVESNTLGMDLKNVRDNSKLEIIKNTIINKGLEPILDFSLGLKVRNENDELKNTEFDIQGNTIINFDIALDFDSYDAPNTSFALGQAGAENTFAGNFVNLVLQREWKNDDPEAKLDLSHNDWGTTDPEEVRTRIDASEEFLNQFVVLADQPTTKLATVISIDSSYTENNADEYKYGYDAFNNIDEALPYLATGGLILVNDGTYEAPLWIDRPMHIKGNGDQVKLVEHASLAAETQSEMTTVVAPGVKFENLHFDGKFIGLRFKDYRPKQYNVKKYESVAHSFEVTDCTFTGFKSVAINAEFSYSDKTFDNAKVVIKDNDISRHLDEKYDYGTGISLSLYDIDIDVEIENNKIHGDYVSGIYARYGNNAIVKNNDVKVSSYSNKHYGIYVSVGGNALIVDNHVENQLENEDDLGTRGIYLNVDDENNKNVFSNRIKGFDEGIHVHGLKKRDYSNILVGGSEANANDLSDNRFGLAATLLDINKQSLNATYNQWGVIDADLPAYIRDENYKADYSPVDYFPSVLSPLNDDANLKSVSATGLQLTPEFDPDTLTYTATVTYYLNRTTVSVETNDISAKAEINNLNVKQLLVDLIVGNNTIEVKVVSPDGTKTLTYTLEITREPEPEPEEPPMYRLLLK